MPYHIQAKHYNTEHILGNETLLKSIVYAITDHTLSDNIYTFKKCLDKCWSSYHFVYLFRAQSLETGSVQYFSL